MLGGKLALLAAAAAGLASPAPAPHTGALPFDAAIEICRGELADRLQGLGPDRTNARLAALTEPQREAVIVLCTAYATGQHDLLQLIRASRATPARQPAASREVTT